MMDTRNLKKVIDWLKTTDLAEVSFRQGGESVQMSLEDTGPAVAENFAGCTLTPVLSPEVGLFHWSSPGAASRIDEGGEVSAGQLLGLIETGEKDHKLKAPAAGRIVSARIDEGNAVQYGQPLFFIQPK